MRDAFDDGPVTMVSLPEFRTRARYEDDAAAQ